MIRSHNRPLLRTVCLCAILIALPEWSTAESGDLRHQIENAIDQVEPALVQIHVIKTIYQNGREMKAEVTGSGTIITPEGHIITNHHVVGQPTRIFCTLLEKERIEAELIGTDPLSDLAVLKLQSQENRIFPYARFGDSKKVQVGDHVLAMGSPVSLSQSVTLGIVSNIGMTLPLLLKKGRYRFLLDGEDVGAFVLWIGHDAAIYQGNSGGPLVDISGGIIGINEIGVGLGGAIPSDLAQPIAKQLIEKGYVTRSWTGWEVQPLLRHDGNLRGVLLSGVAEDSAADKAGFESGDIIVRIGNQPVTIRNPEELPLFNQMEARLPIGEKVPVEIIRNNETRTLHIVPAEREPAQSKTIELKSWGITVQNLSSAAAREMKRISQEGLLITSMRPGGPSGEAKPALRAGDVIRSVNGVKTTSTKKLEDITQTLLSDHTDPIPVLVEFDRQAERNISIVRVGIRDIKDQGLEVRKAWLPATTQVITREMAAMLGIPGLTGVRITQVYTENSVESTGLMVGDIILSIDGDPIPAAQPEDYEIFQNMLRQYAIGATVVLTIFRNNTEIQLPVQLSRTPQLPREMRKYHDLHFEFTVRDLSFQDVAANKLPIEFSGVWVDEVTPGSWAALGELAVGDIIITVDGKPVPDVATLKQMMQTVERTRSETTVFHVLRGVHHIYLELEVK